MLTLPAKILNYVSASLLLYPLLIIRIIFIRPIDEMFLERVMTYLPLLLVLLAFFVLSIIWTNGILKWRNNTRIKGRSIENATMEMAVFLITYIFPLIVVDIHWIWMIIIGSVYISVGIAFVFSDKHFPNPAFLFRGYRLFKMDEKYVLYKGSRDSLRLLLMEQVDGICARELVADSYIVLPDEADF